MSPPPRGLTVASTYRVGDPLASGGNCDVVEAEHLETGVGVVLKLLREDVRAQPEAREGLLAEARAMNAIGVDEAVWLFEVLHQEPWGPMLVLERLHGETLLARLRREGQLPLDAVHPIGASLWAALGRVHARGWVHSALKGSDIFLEAERGRVRLLDFDRAHPCGTVPSSFSRSLGVFSFLAPEEIGKARSADGRADLYAAATILFQALTAQLPYAARNVLQLLELKSKQPARRFSEAAGHTDAALDRFFARALAIAPGDRFQTAEQAGDAWASLIEDGTNP